MTTGQHNLVSRRELGEITGGGLVGFGITIIACSLIADRVGYKPLMVLAFLLHVLSAVVSARQRPCSSLRERRRTAEGPDAAFQCLYWGAFMFSLANGVCESVINPLVATLYPKQKTHYLNILHAGWPGGLILGDDPRLSVLRARCHADASAVGIYRRLLPAAVAVLRLRHLQGQFPISEARAAGVSFGTMLANSRRRFSSCSCCCTPWSDTSNWEPTVGLRTS